MEGEGARPVLRLINIGRTGHEQALRREGDIELVRVPTALEAVGELGEPLDSVERAAVLVGEGAVDGAETAEFLAALRAIDPGAPVVLVADAAHGVAGPGAAGYDGVVGAGANVRAVKAALGARARAGAAEGAGTAVAAADVPAAARDGAGDGAMVAALLTGRDLLIPALELIRVRMGTALVHYVPAEAGVPAPPDGVPVGHRGRVVGHLRSPAGGFDALAAQGAWLGAWLALAEQQTSLRQAAMLDDLTGAYNRRYFDRYLAAALRQAQAQRQTLTLLVFDVDDFKVFNDRYGHPAGDEILRETVRLLRSVIRPGDRVCRIGGDEFAVVFYEPQGPRDPASKPPESVESIAKRFQHQVREHRFPKLGDKAPGSLTISGGLATYPWDGRTVEELLQRADQLALESKRAGKNAITLGPVPG